jgi:hypothetical protein
MDACPERYPIQYTIDDDSDLARHPPRTMDGRCTRLGCLQIAAEDG